MKLSYLNGDDKDTFQNNLKESELHLAFLKELKFLKLLLGRIKGFFHELLPGGNRKRINHIADASIY